MVEFAIFVIVRHLFGEKEEQVEFWEGFASKRTKYTRRIGYQKDHGRYQAKWGHSKGEDINHFENGLFQKNCQIG